MSAARLTIASLLLLAIALIRARGERPNRHESIVLAFAGCALAVHFATWIASLDYTSVAVSTLLVSTTPIWTAAYDAVFHKRGLARGTSVAFAAGAIGLFMVVGFDRTAAPHSGSEWFGGVLAVCGAMGIAGYLLLVRAVRQRLSTQTIVTHTYGWAALTLVLAALIARQAPPGIGDTVAWGGIIAMAIISQLLGHTAINASLRWFTPNAVSFASLLEPVFASMLALVIFREAVPPLALAGGVILLAAVFVVVRNEREEAPAQL